MGCRLSVVSAERPVFAGIASTAALPGLPVTPCRFSLLPQAAKDL